MIAKFIAGAACLAMTTLGLASAYAGEAKPDAPALAKYKRTGQYQTCLTAHLIQSSRILNRHQILFEMIGGGVFLAEPEHCPGLSSDLALAYDATNDELCNTTIIRLVEPGSSVPNRGGCDIERFEKLERK
jgi:hypothetical protein